MPQVGLWKINSGWEVDEYKDIKVIKVIEETVREPYIPQQCSDSWQSVQGDGGNETRWMAWPIVYALPGNVDGNNH